MYSSSLAGLKRATRGFRLSKMRYHLVIMALTLNFICSILLIGCAGNGGAGASLQGKISSHYVFWGYEHMYTLGTGNALTNQFLDFMLTPDIQQLAAQMGYVPINQIKIQTLRARVMNDQPSLLAMRLHNLLPETSIVLTTTQTLWGRRNGSEVKHASAQ